MINQSREKSWVGRKVVITKILMMRYMHFWRSPHKFFFLKFQTCYAFLYTLADMIGFLFLLYQHLKYDFYAHIWSSKTDSKDRCNRVSEVLLFLLPIIFIPYHGKNFFKFLVSYIDHILVKYVVQIHGQTMFLVKDKHTYYEACVLRKVLKL